MLLPLSCSTGDSNSLTDETPIPFYYGADLSYVNEMEDCGATYRDLNNVQKDPYVIFKEAGAILVRVRLWYSPTWTNYSNYDDVKRTIQIAKAQGMKVLLDFHYSDTWADPGKQQIPSAWLGVIDNTEVLGDSLYNYTYRTLEHLSASNVLPDMVQVGNEITPGFIWPDGKIYKESGEDWESFCTLLKAGINGVKTAYGDTEVPIMIHIDKGGDQAKTKYFFEKIGEYGVQFDMIGLSYYPWWHGTFNDLEKNLEWLSDNYSQDIVIVETAYYSNGYYPEPDEWVLDVQPYPPTEQGQYDYLVALDSIVRQYPKVKGIFYWKPDGLYIPDSKVWYIGRSLFDKKGNAYKGITAFKN